MDPLASDASWLFGALRHVLATEGFEVSEWSLLLVGARVIPVATLTPWLAYKGTPMVVRGSIAFALALALAAVAAGTDLPVPTRATDLVPALTVELAIGVLFAVAASVPFYGLAWAGELADRWRGHPMLGEHASPLSQLLPLFAVVLFWTSGGAVLCVELFRLGVEQVPLASPGGFPAEAFAHGLIKVTASALGFGLAVASPAAATLILLDTVALVAARGIPSLPLQLSHPLLRSLVGLWGVFVALATLSAEHRMLFREAFGAALEVLRTVFP